MFSPTLGLHGYFFTLLEDLPVPLVTWLMTTTFFSPQLQYGFLWEISTDYTLSPTRLGQTSLLCAHRSIS